MTYGKAAVSSEAISATGQGTKDAYLGNIVQKIGYGKD